MAKGKRVAVPGLLEEPLVVPLMVKLREGSRDLVVLPKPHGVQTG